MAFDTHRVTVSRLSRSDFETALGIVATAHAEAQEAKRKAEDEVAIQLDELKAKERAFDKHKALVLKSISGARARATSAKRNAAEADNLLRESAAARQRYDDITPWLVDFVDACLRKIIGQIDHSDLIAAVVTEAIADVKSTEGLVLRVATSDRAALESLIRRHPERFAAIETVVSDSALRKGGLVLQGQGSSAEIGIEAQLSVLAAQIGAAT